MDRMLTTPREREAGRLLKLIIQRLLGDDAAFPEELEELVDLAVHELVEAGAERGRAQIQ